MKKKRGVIYASWVSIFLAIVAFFILLLWIGVTKVGIEEKSAEELCRLSIATREKTGIDIPVAGEKEVAPLICPTSKSEDIGKDMTKEELKKYIAEKIARCFYKYYESNVEDVFKASAFTTKCQICQPFNVKKWKEYKEGDKITNEDLIVFMYSNIYKEIEDDDDCKMFGGYCRKSCEQLGEDKGYEFKIEKDTKCKKDEVCCYSPYDCWNKGGICSEDNPGLGERYLEYDKWKCDDGKCWLKDENYYTYLEYIQKYGTYPAVVAILTPDIHPGESYATSFGSPTEKCGELCEKFRDLGLGIGVIGAVTTIAGAYTLNPAVVSIGLKTIAVGGITGIVGGGTAKIETMIYNALKERKVNTIYLTTYNDVTQGNICEVS